jgi:hypothetical protein
VHRVEAGALVAALRAANALVTVHRHDLMPERAATSRSARSWFSVVCSSVETRR